MVNNHFVEDSLVSVRDDQDSFISVQDYLSKFLNSSRAIINDHKIYYWLDGLDEPPSWISIAWIFVLPRVVVTYIGIIFGVGLSPSTMWD